MSRRSAPGMQSLGLPWLLVTVDEVTNGSATVHDQLGQVHQVQMLMRSKGSQKPSAGEKWIVDRALGGWTFAAAISTTNEVDVEQMDESVQSLQEMLDQILASQVTESNSVGLVKVDIAKLQSTVADHEALLWMS